MHRYIKLIVHINFVLNYFIGELTLLSVNRKIDVDNCIAITPTGHLVLSLTVEDYQKFGLEGKPSFFDRKIHSRYSKYKGSKT